jgi:hypothetical protein
MVSAKLYIYSSDGQKLQTTMGYFVRNKLSTSRVIPTTQTSADYIKEFVATSKANNNALVPPSVNPGNNQVVGILRTRRLPAHVEDTITKYSVGESYDPAAETDLSAVVRGVKEELGCIIDPAFFHKISADKFDILIDAAAKQKILTNYSNLAPITEIYDVKWVPIPIGESVSPGLTPVKQADIADSPLIAEVLAAKSSVLPPSLNLAGADPVITKASDGISFDYANYQVYPPAPPPPPPSSTTYLSKADVSASMVPSSGEYTGPAYPAPTPGETLSDYVKRIGASFKDPKELNNIRKFGLSVGLKGGRKTIRRKKLGHSKRKGTSKKGVRRSH